MQNLTTISARLLIRCGSVGGGWMCNVSMSWVDAMGVTQIVDSHTMFHDSEENYKSQPSPTLFLVGLICRLTGNTPFLKLWRGNQTGWTARCIVSGLPPVMIVFANNLRRRKQSDYSCELEWEYDIRPWLGRSLLFWRDIFRRIEAVMPFTKVNSITIVRLHICHYHWICILDLYFGIW